MDVAQDHSTGRNPVHRRAVLAERLLIDLGEATTRPDAAALVAQGLHAVGGAAGVRIAQRDPDVPDAPALVLAQSGTLDPDDDAATSITDRESGLEITLSSPEVPPVAVMRSLRALATVLDRISDQERLLTEARTDPLTGLLNRRALDERLEAELARQARSGGVASLLLLDIDRFKHVNDRKGHAHGDMVLRSVADAIRSVARTADVMGRIGGDEFALLATDTDADGAAIVAARLGDSIRPIGVTVSIGAATAHGNDDWTVQGLLRAADQALYAAKRGGRDQVVSAHGAVDV